MFVSTNKENLGVSIASFRKILHTHTLGLFRLNLTTILNGVVVDSAFRATSGTILRDLVSTTGPGSIELKR